MRDNRFEYIRQKSVLDSDGFSTDYTWYYDNENNTHVFVFGDSDIYSPEDENFDYECDSEDEAQEWFDDYDGIYDEDLYEDVAEPKKRTVTTTYRNKRNPHKKIEMHDDGYGHRSYRQYMKWDKGETIDCGDGKCFVQDADVKNFTGDGNLHRERRPFHRSVIDTDYELDECKNQKAIRTNKPQNEAYGTKSAKSKTPDKRREAIKRAVKKSVKGYEFESKKRSDATTKKINEALNRVKIDSFDKVLDSVDANSLNSIIDSLEQADKFQD